MGTLLSLHASTRFSGRSCFCGKKLSAEPWKTKTHIEYIVQVFFLLFCRYIENLEQVFFLYWFVFGFIFAFPLIMSNTRLAEVFLRTNLISRHCGNLSQHTAEIYLPLVGKKKPEKISPSLGPDLHFTFTLPTLTCNEVLFVTALSAFGWEKKKGEDKSTSDGPRFANNISLQVCVHKCIWTWLKSENGWAWNWQLGPGLL